MAKIKGSMVLSPVNQVIESLNDLFLITNLDSGHKHFQGDTMHDGLLVSRARLS